MCALPFARRYACNQIVPVENYSMAVRCGSMCCPKGAENFVTVIWVR